MRLHGFALLVAAAWATPLRAQEASDTLPASVVQRFVDAANALDVNAMMAVVAPDAVFTMLPAGRPLATGRDSVRALYDRMFARPATRVWITVESRMADGAFTVDHEHFQGPDGKSQGHATWIYHVAGGLIRHAWVLRQPRAETR